MNFPRYFIGKEREEIRAVNHSLSISPWPEDLAFKPSVSSAASGGSTFLIQGRSPAVYYFAIFDYWLYLFALCLSD